MGMRAPLRSLRILRKNWKLSCVALFSLSIAMALVVVSLSVSNTFLLVAPGGGSSVGLAAVSLRSPQAGIEHVSYPDYEYYRAHNRVFTDLAAVAESINVFRAYQSTAEGRGTEVTASDDPVSTNYFSVLGVRPYLGRFFAQQDEDSKSSVAVMTYSFWRRLGADRGIVGKTISSYTIIGVAPKSFTGSLFGLNGDLVVPLGPNYGNANRAARSLFLIGRLKPGVSGQQAQANLSVLSGELAAAYPKDDKGLTAAVTRATLLPPDAIPDAKFAIGILLLLVVLVLTIACANVANLLLALAATRRQEATIKMALGASRRIVIREFLRESAILCVASGAIGYALAEIVARRYAAITVPLPMLGSYSLGLDLHFGAPVIASTMALVFLAMLSAGLPAALYASSSRLSQVLSGEIVAGGRRKTFRRNALVVVQVAVCTLVLVGLGLCWQSLRNLRGVNPGFSARNLIANPMYPGDSGLSPAQGKDLYAKVRRSVAALPGVESVALASDLPLLGDMIGTPVRLPGSAKPFSVPSVTVDPGYFATLGVPILSGRVFSFADTGSSPDLLVVNEKFARTLWPSGDAIGRTVLTGDPPREATIIGVVANGKYGSLDEAPQPFMYYSTTQHYQPGMSVIARTAGDPRLWAKPIMDTMVKATNAGPGFIFTPMTFADLQDFALISQRIVAGCVAALGALGLLLAIAGLAGAVSYSVSQRGKEFGIRTALGARRWSLLKMVSGEALAVAGVGVVAGLVLGVVATAMLRSQFFGIATLEWRVLFSVAAAMLCISIVVAWIAAMPWTRVDPAEALRHV